YLCNYDDKGKAIYADSDIICFSFALSDGEHDKSTSFPDIDLIIFDEFLTNRLYLNDEFILFMNTVSTIVRRREDVKIYML
ncbi:phage DNA encapsidation protein, partial [Salmonella enterica]|uniref:phage DNA encapsidation protein n=1 Tax=Salmonella enterica TaxID=28901 RepID=UPI003CEFCBB9